MYKYSCVYTNSSRKFCVGHKMNNEAKCNVFQMLTEDNVVRIYVLYIYSVYAMLKTKGRIFDYDDFIACVKGV